MLCFAVPGNASLSRLGHLGFSDIFFTKKIAGLTKKLKNVKSNDVTTRTKRIYGKEMSDYKDI